MRALLGALLVGLGVVGCGGGDDDGARPPAVRTPVPDTRVVEGDGELAVGITEPNPAFISAGDVPEPFGRWRDELAKMKPRYYRLVVDWAGVMGEDGRSFDLAKPNGGCMRDVPPCAGYGGVRAQLAALAEAQEKAGWEILVVLAGTPERFARPPSGCERGGTQPRSRPPTPEGVAVYGELVGELLDLAREVGVELRYWAPWNEPNHPFFISPQREACRARAASTAIGPYVELAQELQRALEDADGDQELVLGELAGLLQRKSGYTGVEEFITELPRELVCAAPVFSQHGYVGGPDPVDEIAGALAKHGCERTHQIWMTETGAGRPRRGGQRDRSREALNNACRAIHRRLVRWYEDPRVTAAFQYTFREDDRFPTGLISTDLAEAYPALREWQGWGGDRDPRDPAPKSAC